MRLLAFLLILQSSAAQTAAEDFSVLARDAAAAREAARVPEAITKYRSALELRPDWDEGWWYLGTLLYSADRRAEAVEAFAPVLRRYPKNGAAWAFTGLALFEERKFDEALPALEKARAYGVGENPGLVSLTRYRLGILLNRYSRFDDARRELEKLADPKSDQPEVALALGISMLLLPHLPEELPEAHRDVATRIGRAAYLAASDRREDAARAIEEAVRLYPRTPNVHYARGLLLMGSGQADHAISAFRDELEVSPRHVSARLHLVDEHLRRAEADAALPLARDAASFGPEWYLTHQMLGRVLLETGDIEGAIRELEIAVDQRANEPMNHFHLARAYRMAERFDDAAKAVETFQRLDRSRKAELSR